MGKVTRKMYRKELRPFYGPAMFLAYMISSKWGLALLKAGSKIQKGRNIKGLRCEQRYIPSKNGGPDIRIRIFRPEIKGKLPAMLYNHGGGYIMGIPEEFLGIIKNFIMKRPCVIVAPDYRKAGEEPFPAGFNDCYDTLLWMKENADTLNIRSDKFMLGGHSAGGGLTAAVTLKACDTKDVDIAFQMPIYPMIDHRQDTPSAKEMDKGVPAWNRKTNERGWDMYLKNVEGDVPAYASAILAEKFDHLPPTITFVGELEPFRDETVNYVKELEVANVPVKFELFKGAFHAFDIVAGKTSIGKKAHAFLYDSFAEYYETYL